jgi:hypothetical protein
MFLISLGFDRFYVVLHYLGEGEFSKHRWSFFGEEAAVCHEMPGRLVYKVQ